MVAFGHYIEHLKTMKPEWASRFLNYGNLKTIIARLREVTSSPEEDRGDADSDEETPFVCYNEEDLKIYKGYEPVTAEEVSDLFKRALLHEVDKAGCFHSKLLDHFKESLDCQTEDFWSGLDRTSEGGSSHANQTLTHSQKQQIAKNSSKYWQNKRMCETLYQEISALKHFSATHRIAIRKIIKKFNKELKRIGENVLQIDTSEYLTRYNTKAQDPQCGGYSNILLETIECTYAEFHTCQDINDARQQLQSSKFDTKPQLDLFVMGLLLGFMLPLVILVVYLYYSNEGAVDLSSFWVVLPLYRMLALSNLAMWAWGVDLFLFNNYYLNHTYILGLNPETQLQWPTMINYAAIFTILNCANLAVHFLLYGVVHIHFSVFFVYGCLLVLVLPLPVLQWNTRRALLRSVGRCARLPLELPFKLLFNPESLVTVQFRDFFFADQLTSASILLGDLVYFSCFTYTGAWRAAPAHALHHASMCLEINNSLKPFIICWPYVWRACQCVVMLKVTKNRVHVLNCGKYMICILVLVVGFVAQHTQYEFMWHIWVLVTFVGQFYSWMWDYLMDWGWKLYDTTTFWSGKLSRKGSKGDSPTPCSPLVSSITTFKTRRRHLSWVVHSTCIPLDLFCRMLFFTTIDEGISPWLPDPRMLSLFLGIVEIMRRCVWNVLRIENEQLHNLESYRSKTDEVPEPLNQIFGEEWVNQNSNRKQHAHHTPSHTFQSYGTDGLPLPF
eukprot:TRINITY_DN33852_c0_g1_i1.p1 TRINITY_DN33852_c0_g1~~TRINITY_DN33852_c0_g1_i1.p1  ORF type:complete len:745 (+),score=104.53 TRINITY_DN33852_c0_g1_i1:55-2235(+)